MRGRNTLDILEHDMRPSHTLAVTLLPGSCACLAIVALTVVSVTTTHETVHAAQGRPVATADAQASEREWPEKAYRVDWVEADIPEEAAANVMLAVPVTLRNIGNRAWPASAVFVAYHWFRDDKLLVWDGGLCQRRRRSASSVGWTGRVKLSATSISA